jgi:hypothetical protein
MSALPHDFDTQNITLLTANEQVDDSVSRLVSPVTNGTISSTRYGLANVPTVIRRPVI